MASEKIIDASVFLAVLKGERAQENLLDIIDGAIMSAVNLTEILTKLLDLGMSATTPEAEATFSLLDRIEPFTESQSRIAADLRARTRHAGLSLGDRACLALALECEAVVYTAEHVWSRIDVGCEIRHIR